jgi:hypothetical protein
VYVFLLLLSFKEHGILARRDKNSHILARADNESCTELAVLGYTPEKLECVFEVQTKRA